MQFKRTLLHKKVSIQRRTKPCYSREIHVPTAYLVTLAKIQDTPARKVARNHSSFVLCFNLISQHKNKRFYVTEIVLPLGFADVTFGWREGTTRNTHVSAGQGIRRTNEKENKKIYMHFFPLIGGIKVLDSGFFDGGTSYPGQFALSELPQEAWNRVRFQALDKVGT